MKAFLDHFAAILAAATIMLLLISISHEYGYFWVIGRNFQTFLTTSDYFGNAVLWLPALAFVLYFFLDWDVLLGKARYQPFGLNWGTAFTLFATVIGPIISIFFFPGDALSFTYLIPLILLWLMYGTRILPFAEADSDLLRHTRRLLIVAPVVLIVALGSGIDSGKGALKSVDELYTLDMKDRSQVQRNVLRTLDRGLLVRDTEGSRIEFVKWDEVRKVSRFSAQPRAIALSCSWFQINCHSASPTR